MAFAWFSVKCSFAAAFSDALVRKRIPSVAPFTRQFFTCSRFLLPLKISIIKSITSQALINPSWISCFSFSLESRVLYFRVVTSNWKSTWCSIICFKLKVSGLPFATASMLTPNVSSRRVFLYSILVRFSISVPFLSSNTIRIPSFEDWFEISTISVVFLDSTSPATSFKNFPMFAPIIVYGISVITSRFLPALPFSISTFPRSLIFPVPFS